LLNLDFVPATKITIDVDRLFCVSRFDVMKINLIVAACGKSLGIGKDGQLPWRLPAEMKHFARLTTNCAGEKGATTNAVVMGRKTWESIPAKFRPLKNRLNVVLTRNKDFAAKDDDSDVVICGSLEAALTALKAKGGLVETAWIIGGSSVYEEALDVCHRVYLTKIEQEFECDVFFPELKPDLFKEVQDPKVPTQPQTEGDIAYRYLVLEKQ